MSHSQDYFAVYRRNANRLLREEALDEYGRKCRCCGLDDPRFLSLAHTNNDGAAARRKLGPRNRVSSAEILRDLKRRGWPKDEGIGIECFNCNMGAARNGGVCPHVPELPGHDHTDPRVVGRNLDGRRWTEYQWADGCLVGK
jgi:hypothetical protein